MKNTYTNTRQIEELDLKYRLRLAVFWILLMFLYAFGDYLTLFHPGFLQKILDSEGLMVASSAMMIIPGIMIYLSLGINRYLSRIFNLGVALAFVGIMLISMPDQREYCLFMGSVELILLASIIYHSLSWPEETEV